MEKPIDRIRKQYTPKVAQDWIRIKTIDMHTGGEPLRVILDGLPVLKGKSVLDYRRFMQKNHDTIRKLLIHEPRGHADMYGCILLPPNTGDADFGILFLHNDGYSTMCGHAVIAITKLAVEMNWVDTVDPITEVKIDAPCGRINSFALVEKGKVKSVFFHGVPSFVVSLDNRVSIPGLGDIEYDLAYGGAFYAYVNADKYDISLDASNYSELIGKGMAIKRAVMESNKTILHPFEEDLSFLYGTIFISNKSENADNRNVCIFANGEVDRSPTGSGVSGRMAIHFKRKELAQGETMKIESIVGSIFSGSVVEEIDYGPFKAVIPRVEGNAFITGHHEFYLDPDDPFGQGFFLR